jgi:hypothetical protein
MSFRNTQLNEIQFNIESVNYCYIGLGTYEDNQDGIFRYWPNIDSKSDYYAFLKSTDLCILLLTIGQQANLGEANHLDNSKMNFIKILANKYFEEFDAAILLKQPLFLDFSIENNSRAYFKVESKSSNNFDNIFILKTAYDELVTDLTQYIELWNGH